MQSLVTRHLQGPFVKWCVGSLGQTLTLVSGRHNTRTCCRETSRTAHHLRSPYSVLRHHYKCSQTLEEAKMFVSRFPGLKSVSRSQLDQTLALIKQDGYLWREVEMCRQVLLLSPGQYTQRVHLLKQLSITQPSLSHITWMIAIMDCPVRSLEKSFGHILTSDPVEQILKAGVNDLHLPESVIEGGRELAGRDDQVMMKHVFLHLIQHYLALRFSKDVEEVGRFLESIQFSILQKPPQHYPEICDALIHCLHISFVELQKQPRLLNIDPENTKLIVQKFPVIGGVAVRDVAVGYPKLLDIPAAHLERWLTLLHKYQVDKFTYTQHTTALFKTNSFPKVEQKLQILSQLSEWEIIVVSDKLFEILRSSRSVKMLLNTSESGQIIVSLNSAINPEQDSIYKQWRQVTPEIVVYVAFKLGLPVEEVREVLTEEIYTPFGINNVKAVLKLLLDYGFTREQVLLGATLLNVEVSLVEESLMALHTRPEAQPFAEWIENPFILHLLAYCIKKDVPHLELPVRK